MVGLYNEKRHIHAITVYLYPMYDVPQAMLNGWIDNTQNKFTEGPKYYQNIYV